MMVSSFELTPHHSSNERLFPDGLLILDMNIWLGFKFLIFPNRDILVFQFIISKLNLESNFKLSDVPSEFYTYHRDIRLFVGQQIISQ